jgi:N-acetyl-gamma-glutamyl-phosphate reductase
MNEMTKPSKNASITTAILGASGYTGAELLRLIEHHPQIHIAALTGDSQAGKTVGEIYPHLAHRDLPRLVKLEEVDIANIDLVFCCLPHGTTQPILAALPESVSIVDLSADFRLEDPAQYEEWYGHPHQAIAVQKTSIYGLTEHARTAVSAARLVANPGCYPTCSLLPLLPLVTHKLIDVSRISINALSGISGAGRSVKQQMLFTELDGGVSAYGLGHHRHMAEMEQELSKAAGTKVKVSFTPHLVPITRGMLATIQVTLAGGATISDLQQTLKHHYAQEAFIRLTEHAPTTHAVKGTNRCHISVHAGRRAGEAIVVSVIDNLGKGASGQALQNANLMFGLPETTGLVATAVFP